MKHPLKLLSFILFASFVTGCNGCNTGSTQDTDSSNQEQTAKDTSSESAENNKQPTPDQDRSKAKKSKGYDSIQIDIRGYIKDGENLEVILDQLLIAEREPLTATVVDENDRFGFVGKVEGPGLFQIRFPSGTIPIILNGGEIEIKTDINNLNNYEISGEGGAEATKDFRRMRQRRGKIQRMDDSLQQVLEETEGKKRIEIHKKLNKIHQKQDKKEQEFLKGFVQEMQEKESIVAVLGALRMDIKKDPEFVRSVAQQYHQIYPNNYFVESLLDKVDQYDKLMEQQKKRENADSAK